MSTEEKIIELLASKDRTKMGFSHSVEVMFDYDEDGDEQVTVVNAVENTPDGLIVYDFRDQDEDGNADPEWDVEDLSENIQKEILWALTEHPWDVWNWEPYKD
jgi:hypothetical protein